MANEPSASGLIVLTGMTIAAVVGLYAYDAIPRRDGITPTAQISWPSWQSNDSAPSSSPVQQSAPAPAPAYSDQQGQQPYPQEQLPYPQDQGYSPAQPPQEQYPQDPRGQDLPADQQQPQGGAGQPPGPDGSPRG